MVVYLKQRIKEGNWQESDFVQIVWDALMQAVDWSTRPEMIENQASRQIKVGLYFYNINFYFYAYNVN
jgi:hypothetical protein